MKDKKGLKPFKYQKTPPRSFFDLKKGWYTFQEIADKVGHSVPTIARTCYRCGLNGKFKEAKDSWDRVCVIKVVYWPGYEEFARGER